MVTGAAGGIGRDIARRLAADGFHIFCVDIDEAGAQAAAQEVHGEALAADVSSEDSVLNCWRRAAQSPRQLYGLVNCAGLHTQAPVTKTTSAQWDHVHQVNARGTFLMCREAARTMLPQRSGRIVNIITRLGFGNPYSAVYMASKYAVWGLTQCLAAELARAGITVNAVAPGHVGPGTGMEKHFRDKAQALQLDWETFERRTLQAIPLGRWCHPHDVAAAVSFLLRDEAAFMTGEIINMTGGFSGYSYSLPPEASQ